MARINCDCKSDNRNNSNAVVFQEKSYGKGIRVATTLKDKTGNPVYRCTVCLKETNKTI